MHDGMDAPDGVSWNDVSIGYSHERGGGNSDGFAELDDGHGCVGHWPESTGDSPWVGDPFAVRNSDGTGGDLDTRSPFGNFVFLCDQAGLAMSRPICGYLFLLWDNTPRPEIISYLHALANASTSEEYDNIVGLIELANERI